MLIVEDEPAILKLASSVLERYGYRVLAVESPAQALELAARHGQPIHLLLSDMVMPEMNGKAPQEKIQASHPSIKVLFVSGYTADVIAHHGVLEKGLNYVQKPFTVKALAGKVREVLDRE